MNSQKRRRIQIFLVSCALISLRPRHWLPGSVEVFFILVCAIDLQLATCNCIMQQNMPIHSIRWAIEFRPSARRGISLWETASVWCWGWLSDIRSLFQDRPSCHPRRRCWSMLGGSRQEDLLLLLRSSTAPRVQQDDRMTDTLAHSSSPHLSSPALVVKSKVLCIMVTPEDTPIEKGINH